MTTQLKTSALTLLANHAKMKTMRTILVVAVGILALTAGSTQAALVVTDGGFANPNVGTTDNNNNQNVGSWYDSSTSWSSFVYYNSQLASTSQMYGSEVDGGWIYQSLGTVSAKAGSISFTFDAVERNRNTPYGWPEGLTIDLYEGAFGLAADGTDIDLSLSSIGAIVISRDDIFATPTLNTGADRETVNFTTSSIDLTGVLEGTEVWVRIETNISNPAVAKGLYLDNFSANVSFIPEPSTAILAGLGLAGLTLRRRRK